MNKFYLLFIFIPTFTLINAQDNCNSAVNITTEGVYSVGTINGEFPSTNCFQSGATNAEWYKFTPTENISITITTDLSQNTGGDTRVSLFSGDCNNLTCIASDDDGGHLGTGLLSVLNSNVTAGQTYYIVFDNRWSSNGFDFELVFNESVPDPPFTFSIVNVNLNTAYTKAVVDMNGDFLDDIVGVNQGNIVILSQNAGGTFSSNSYNTPNVNYVPSWSIAAGDIDGNGYNDLLYGGGSGVTFIFANETGNFYQAANSSNYIFSQRTNFVDINNDGHLDAFICHDIQPNVYFLNDGNGNLEFNQGGLGNTSNGGNYGSIWTDFDNDGRIDLFIAKCRGGSVETSKDQLWHNNGNGTYTNVAAQAGVEDPIQSWSSAWGDFDNDGDMDMLAGANSFSQGGHKLRENNGSGIFTNVTAGSGFDTVQFGSIDFITYDMDNDGYLDILTNINSGTAYLNNGDMTFSPITNVPFGSYGDLNNDGFMDIQVGNNLYINNGNDNHWVTINTVGTLSNRNGIGARIEIYGPWGVQIRDVRSGEGFEFMNTLNTHFGLGASTMIDTLVIKWPSGVVDTYQNLSADSTYLLTETETLATDDLPLNEVNITVSPMPVKETIFVRGTDERVELTLLDLSGRTIKKLIGTEMNVDELKSGVYILKIKTSENQIITEKIIIE